MRSRSMKIRVAGPEVASFLRDLRNTREDPAEVVRVLSSAPAPSWLLERIPGIQSSVWTALGRSRDRLHETPGQAPEAYSMQGGVIRMGLPASTEVWTALLDAQLPEGLLARLAGLPGAPFPIRSRLLEHPDLEVRHQAILAPDVPTSLLEERLEHGDTVALLSILDRDDVGPVTLERSIQRGDPHVLYRVGRHGALDLLLLSRIRKARRRGIEGPLPPSRVLHVYAPGIRQGGALGTEARDRIVSSFVQNGFQLLEETDQFTREPELGADGSVRIVCARVSLSRLLVFLPVEPRNSPGSLDLERLVETLKQRLSSGLAEEVVELTVDEEFGFWEADIRQRGSPAQRLGASDLPLPGPEDPASRWLEFELFCAERALAYPGFPAHLGTRRLVTRAPYGPHPRDTEWQRLLSFTPVHHGSPEPEDDLP